MLTQKGFSVQTQSQAKKGTYLFFRSFLLICSKNIYLEGMIYFQNGRNRQSVLHQTVVTLVDQYVRLLERTLLEAGFICGISRQELIEANLALIGPLQTVSATAFESRTSFLEYTPIEPAVQSPDNRVENRSHSPYPQEGVKEELEKYRYKPGRQHEDYRNRNLKCGLHPLALCMSAKLEKRLCEWVAAQGAKFGGVTRLEIREKARRLFGKQEFMASVSWLKKFLKKHPQLRSWIGRGWTQQESLPLAQQIQSEESEEWDLAGDPEAPSMNPHIPECSNKSLLSEFEEPNPTIASRGSRK